MDFPTGDFLEAWTVLADAKIATPVGGADAGGGAAAYAFRHETFLAFYVMQAIFQSSVAAIWQRLHESDKPQPAEDQLRWNSELERIETFRSAYLLFADTGDEADVKAVAEAWKLRWLATDDRFYREYEARVARRFPRPRTPPSARTMAGGDEVLV
jgi:hypothetical protein